MAMNSDSSNGTSNGAAIFIPPTTMTKAANEARTPAVRGSSIDIFR